MDGDILGEARDRSPPMLGTCPHLCLSIGVSAADIPQLTNKYKKAEKTSGAKDNMHQHRKCVLTEGLAK